MIDFFFCFYFFKFISLVFVVIMVQNFCDVAIKANSQVMAFIQVTKKRSFVQQAIVFACHFG